jgi:chorismate mutase/prephenate dehydratase
VQAGRATYGVVPIENSSEGAISRTLDLLLDTNLIISGEISIPIEHALLSVSTDLSQVKQVLAHAQALAQCQEWLNVHAPHLQRQAVSSNAQAAKLASVDPELAAIASLGAAKHYGLQVVHAAIQDDVHNRTRFVVIGQHACAPSGNDQTSLILSVANEPGAVYQLLAPLAKYGVSMTRLESRPARRGTWEYHFYIDIEGHQSEVHIASALQELRSMAAFYKCVGSYPKSKI